MSTLNSIENLVALVGDLEANDLSQLADGAAGIYTNSAKGFHLSEHSKASSDAQICIEVWEREVWDDLVSLFLDESLKGMSCSEILKAAYDDQQNLYLRAFILLQLETLRSSLYKQCKDNKFLSKKKAN